MQEPNRPRPANLNGLAQIVTDDLDQLLAVLPPHICDPLLAMPERRELLEVVMDLGREPEARLPGREVLLSTHTVTEEDIDYVVQRIGVFGDDNRAGIERTLHRISAIRNREGRIVGITCRVGRAVFGTVAIIRDIVESGRSILMMGRPGVGKTTLLREAARVLADDLRKRVMIVDTSNEIGGDGDIPHPAVGRARRMQVPTPSMQHAVMIEAVENHMPEVIVIDEIGTELEATAARTIAERGVQLVATAHGNTLENLMMNPTLSDLIGGIQSVTLSDEEARRRGTQKSVLERKAPPTFDVIVEIQNWSHVAVHEDVAEVVDGVLRGQAVLPTVRRRGADGEVLIEEPLIPRAGRTMALPDADRPAFSSLTRSTSGRPRTSAISDEFGFEERRASPTIDRRPPPEPHTPPASGAASTSPSGHRNGRQSVRIYPFGVNRSRLESQIRSLGLPATVVADQHQADVVLTVRNYYRRKPQALRDAEATGVPVHVLRSNSAGNIEQELLHISHLDAAPVPGTAQNALRETEDAIARVLETSAPVELSPQSAYIRRLQHQLAEQHSLSSRSTGKEPYRRVRIAKAD
ncbi:MAG TPA: R3H domain-containing nucleic acid-binding protein [Chloroflexota bacterium]|nr:R3H domain-containing nucleic acid-binding protein [Chloroflexota bacterium]